MNAQTQNALPLIAETTASTADNKPSIQQIAAQKALYMLKALKAKYVIVLVDGTVLEEGGLQLAVPKPEPKPRTRKPVDPTVPYGTYTKYLKEQGLHAMLPGDVLVIDLLTFAPESIRGTAGALAVKLWGNASVLTSVRNGMVEIMRLK